MKSQISFPHYSRLSLIYYTKPVTKLYYYKVKTYCLLFNTEWKNRIDNFDDLAQ